MHKAIGNNRLQIVAFIAGLYEPEALATEK